MREPTHAAVVLNDPHLSRMRQSVLDQEIQLVFGQTILRMHHGMVKREAGLDRSRWDAEQLERTGGPLHFVGLEIPGIHAGMALLFQKAKRVLGRQGTVK